MTNIGHFFDHFLLANLTIKIVDHFSVANIGEVPFGKASPFLLANSQTSLKGGLKGRLTIFFTQNSWSTLKGRSEEEVDHLVEWLDTRMDWLAEAIDGL